MVLYLQGGRQASDVSYDPTARRAPRDALLAPDASVAACLLRGEAPTLATARAALDGLRVAQALIQSAAEERDVTLA